MHYVTQSCKYIVEEFFLMNNQELLQKMKEDMEMRGFSHCTKESYEGNT